MYPDFRIGPMEHWAPSQEVRVRHLLQSVLDVILRTVGEHNLVIGPGGIVGKQNRLAELNAA